MANTIIQNQVDKELFERVLRTGIVDGCLLINKDWVTAETSGEETGTKLDTGGESFCNP